MSLWIDTSKAVGFTGTGHKDLAGSQFRNLKDTLQQLWLEGYRVFRHGDCIHADAQADQIAYDIGYWVIIHPPTNEYKRAFCGKDRDRTTILPPKLYLDRNHDIVDNSEVLIACPKEVQEQLRSGTWATVRFARKKGRKIYLILP